MNPIPVKTNMNIAYIDGNNLHMGTAKAQKDSWRIDMRRFRVLLEQKYHVGEAYYFIGMFDPKHQQLYIDLQRAGFILVFREHGTDLLGKKKGNVDVDLTFQVMRDVKDRKDMDKVVIVSGDGDYYRMVEYLVEQDRFEKIMFPNRKFASSLYKRITRKHFVHLDDPGVKARIERK